MTLEMRIEIKNLGPVNKADLKIAKINVVAGKNNTGKSTLSRLIFSLLTASSGEGNQLVTNDIRLKLLNFIEHWQNKESHEIKDKFKEFEISLTNNSVSLELFEDIYNNIELALENNDLNDLFRLIELNESFMYLSVFNSLIESGYGCSIDNFADASIKFHGNYRGAEFIQNISINHENSGKTISKDFLNYFNFQNIIYIDSPSILESTLYSCQYHLRMLERKIKKNKTPDESNDLKGFKEGIDKLIGGTFEYVPFKDEFIFKIHDETYSIRSTASGLKQLAAIQLLLNNNELTENTFLILDEPETNLHPASQVEFAKILVLAARNSNITLYINTHSPFFAEAIEAYSRYFRLMDDTNFYLAEKTDGAGKYNYNLLDSDEIIDLYDELGNPFDIIHKIKVQADLKEDFGV